MIHINCLEPFTQADESLDRSRGGLGLGLALAKGFVEAHGGTAEARSAGLGRGADFLVGQVLEEEDAGSPIPINAQEGPCLGRDARVLRRSRVPSTLSWEVDS